MFGTRKIVGGFALVGFFLSVIFLVPQVTYAQAFVPVRDQPLTNAFNAFATNFTNTFGGQPNGAGASIRDIISGGNIRARDANGNLTPFGQTYGDCVRGDAQILAYAYPVGANGQESPWRRASNADNTLPLDYPAQNQYVQVNKSESLRCLLMEIVEFQKLNASTQIHQVMLEYLTKAQTKVRANRLSSEIFAADANFLKSGYVSQNNGITEASPLFVTNPDKYKNNEGEREISYLAEQILNDPNDPVSGVGYCDAFKLDAAQQAITVGESLNTDVYDSTDSAVACSSDQPGGIFTNQDEYYQMMNSNADNGVRNLSFMFNNMQNTKLGSLDYTDSIAYERVQQTKAEFDQMTEAGLLPTISNPDDDADPYDVRKFRTRTSPAQSNVTTLEDATLEAKEQIRNAEFTGAESVRDTRERSTELSSISGFSGVDTASQAIAPNPTDQMVKELYNIFNMGYFDISLDTTDWARATMLMIYDEMQFDSDRLADQIPTNAVTPQAGDTQTDEPIFEDFR